MKKILISAFSCAPNIGSDAEVAWNWALSLSVLDYEVWVITRSYYKPQIEEYFESEGYKENLKFIYFEMPNFMKMTSKIKWRNFIYYYFWQWGAYKIIQKKMNIIAFDVVHHVSWVSLRQPSFMGRLGIHFIFGPCAGGEVAPFYLRIGYSARQWKSDILRDVANFFIRFDPMMRSVFRSANELYVTSEQSRKIIPRQFRNKSKIKLAIGINESSTSHPAPQTENTISGGKAEEFNVLYVGRFVGWKGMHLGLKAFEIFHKRFPKSTLTMVGKGRDEKSWRKLSEKLNIAQRINWISWVEQSDLDEIYKQHDCFLFPSLHDSGGLVVLEAMRMGLPIVCLDLGGPGVIVDKTSGIVVSTKKRTQKYVIEELADSLALIAESNELKQKLSSGAKSRQKCFTWDHLVNSIYSNHQ